MKQLKRARKQEADLLALFTPQAPLTAPIEHVLVHPIDVTAPTPAVALDPLSAPLTPLERTIKRLRDQAQQI